MNLKQKVFQAISFQLVRRVISLCLSLLFGVIIIRKLGPANYGIFVIADGIINYFINCSSLGINTYLVRQKRKLEEIEIQQAMTIWLIVSVSILTVILTVNYIKFGFPASDPSGQLIYILAPAILVHAMIRPSICRLENEINYKSISIIEFIDTVVYYGITIFLLYTTELQYFALAISSITRHLIVFALYYISAPFKFKLVFNITQLKHQFKYGVTYDISMWIWNLYYMVNNVLVAKILGSSAVGLIELGWNILRKFYFIPESAWRISLSLFGKIQDSKEQLQNAVNKGIKLTSAIFLPIISILSTSSYLWIQLVFGENYESVSHILLFLALPYGIQSMTLYTSSALYSAGKNIHMMGYHIIYVGGVWLVSWFLIPIYGVIGYLLALWLCLPLNIVNLLFFARQFGWNKSFQDHGLTIAAYLLVLLIGMTHDLIYIAISNALFILFTLTRSNVIGDINSILRTRS